MKRASQLTLEGCVLRLSPGDLDHEGAARQWEEIFGVGRSRDLLAFTNARLGFVRGVDDKAEGLVSITVGVNGKDELEAIFRRAREEGLQRNGWLDICGIKWFIVLSGQGERNSRL